ncbi:MAG: hypothetical protein WCX65_13770 [bacterium]
MMETDVANRNRTRVENTFRVIDLMEDLRDIWRQSAPLQNLTDSEKEKLKKKLEKARKAIEKIEATI